MNWFKDGAGCSEFIHLDCARKDATVVDKFDGTVALAQAGRELIGFCKECFLEMEADRPSPDEGMGVDQVAAEVAAG